jgi:uncharacterized membrane protein
MKPLIIRKLAYWIASPAIWFIVFGVLANGALSIGLYSALTGQELKVVLAWAAVTALFTFNAILAYQRVKRDLLNA